MGKASIDSVREVAAAAGYFAVVAVARSDASVHASVVKAAVFDDPAVAPGPVVAMVLVGGARKLDYLRAARRATVVFQHQGRWVSVEGAARLAGPDDSDGPASGEPLRQLLRAIFVAAGGDHDDWDEYDRVMADDRRTAVLVTPERITQPGG